ncbi:MAG: ABC transporter ATP-binding protein/permease [Clostridia bacterium]|nr:ABC transporter ATP-binding protein/permease [Clostridia bacterium]
MIKVENLKKTYDKGTKRANEVLHNLSFELPDTGFVCILGSSGSGKTSLLNAIGGLDVYDSGVITTENTEIRKAVSKEMERERNANFGYIFQNYYLLIEHSVAYNVYLGMHSLDIPHAEKLKRVKEALTRVDMLRYRKRPVGELSGGQQQRVAIARAIARRPRVIFADEPTGNLDETNTMKICTILKELSKESLVVMVTHETRIAEFFADRIITLERGNIVSDSTEWERGVIDAGEKDTVYSGDYTENNINSENLSVRMLSTEDAEPVTLTVIAEKHRIIVKFNDKRVVLSSDISNAPFLKEGEHPMLTHDSFKQPEREVVKVAQKRNDEGGTGKAKKFLGLKFLVNEAKSSVSEKKLRRFGLGVFIIILTLMISIAVSDFITVSNVDPEDFIRDDSHTLFLKFDRGPNLDKYQTKFDPMIKQYCDHLDASGLEYDMIPKSATELFYNDTSFSQINNLSLTIPKHTLVNISRLDESTIIAGRMPENYNEIVIDRWVIDMALEEDGILQNMISNPEYFVGKTINTERQYNPTIVGICDSGEPSIYMSTEGIISISTGGDEIITLSEFKKLTGFDPEYTLESHECISLDPNEGHHLASGTVYKLRSFYPVLVKETLNEVPGDFDIQAKFVVNDDALDDIYLAMVCYGKDATLWAEDKDSMKLYLDGGVPEEIEELMTVVITDNYQGSYNYYLATKSDKIGARTIIVISIIALSLVMIYLMQRSKIKERMDLITVYRLLGISKRNLMVIFAIESLTTTAKFCIPTILLLFFGIKVVSSVESIGEILIFPWWAALLTFGAIALFRLVFSMIPILTINRKPPAQMAANYDF